MRKLKILEIISQDKMRSGGAIQMYRLSKELAERGHTVVAAYDYNKNNSADFEVFKECKAELKFFKMNKFQINGETYDSIKELRKYLKENKFDIIHAHKGRALDLVFAASVGIKVNIVISRGILEPLDFFNSLKYKSPKVKRVIAISDAVNKVVRETGKIRKSKVTTVLGSVDTTEFYPERKSTLREELFIGKDEKVIGFLGNESEIKGAKILIQSFRKLILKYEKLVLVMAGISKDYLEKLKLSDSEKNRVIPLGFRRDAANCMAGFDIFVFPGIGEEGLGMTIAEAQACAKPVVITNAGATVEMVKDGIDGLVVPKGDVEKLTEAIEKMLLDSDRAEKFGKHSLKFIKKNMTNKIVTDKIEKIYYEIIGDDKK